MGQRPCPQARARRSPLGSELLRYAEEEFAGINITPITFRDGPTGRRAGLVGGPDVWELVMWAGELPREEAPVTVLVEESILTGSRSTLPFLPGRLPRQRSVPGSTGTTRGRPHLERFNHLRRWDRH